jgi:predicted dehydrogenase
MRKSVRRSKTSPVRYAVLGQGYISQVAVLPGFANARRNSELTALVSDDRRKLKTLGRRYGVTRLVRNEDCDELFESGEVDAVYIALPNSMHAEYTISAARAGLHVLCEKPMAVTASECRSMLSAAKQARIKLMVAYRLHFERGNLTAAEVVRSKRLGEIRYFNAQFSMQVKAGNTRLRGDLGGGPLYDIGIYCINAARAAFSAEPTQVWAIETTRPDPRFRNVPEMVTAVMTFPDHRVATFTCGFNAADRSRYEVVGTRGSMRMDPAFEFAEGLEMEVQIGERARRTKFPKRDQFGPELLYFSDCIQRGRDVEPSGEEGLADVQIIEAMHRSMQTGKPVATGIRQRSRRPTLRQEIRRPPVRKPNLVHATTPHP